MLIEQIFAFGLRGLGPLALAVGLHVLLLLIVFKTKQKSLKE